MKIFYQNPPSFPPHAKDRRSLFPAQLPQEIGHRLGETTKTGGAVAVCRALVVISDGLRAFAPQNCPHLFSRASLAKAPNGLRQNVRGLHHRVRIFRLSDFFPSRIWRVGISATQGGNVAQIPRFQLPAGDSHPHSFGLFAAFSPRFRADAALFQPLAVVRVLVHQNKELVVRVAPIPQIIGEIFQKVLLSRIGALDLVFMPLESDFRQETQKKFPRRRLLQKKHKPTHSNGSINLSIRHSRPIISPGQSGGESARPLRRNGYS